MPNKVVYKHILRMKKRVKNNCATIFLFQLIVLWWGRGEVAIIRKYSSRLDWYRRNLYFVKRELFQLSFNHIFVFSLT